MGNVRSYFVRTLFIDRCFSVRPDCFCQFDDVRRNATFMAAKTVPKTNNRGITPGPKLMASPIIHSRMAKVKIVQNTALLPNGCRFRICSSVDGYMGPRDLAVMGFEFGQIIPVPEIRPTILIQKRFRRLFAP